MTAFKYGYRMRVYAARSVDATEATVLTPAAGAPHSDAFQVASIAGVSGYQPYLHDNIQGRRGRLDLKTRKLDIGTWTVTLIDKKVSTDNLSRWWTAFFGNTAGKPMPRLKVQIDECLDTSATSPTWTTCFTGEVIGSKTVNKVDIAMTLRERSETLKMQSFVGTPHSSITYASLPSLLPIGLRGNYGSQRATGTLTATARPFVVNGTSYAPTGEILLIVSGASRTQPDLVGNIVTQNLLETLPPHTVIQGINFNPAASAALATVPEYNGTLRAYVSHGGNSGVFLVGALAVFGVQYPGQERHQYVMAVAIKALESTDVGYLAAPTSGTSCTFQLYAEEVTDGTPLLIDDVDPATLLEDLCAGKFGQIYREPMKLPAGKSYGDVVRGVSTASFASFKSVKPTQRFVIKKGERLGEWAEKNILIPNHWGWYLDGSGQVNLVDLAMPNSTSGIATLTDADVIEEDDVDWQHDPTQAVWRVDMARYSERLRLPKELWQSPDLNPRIEGLAIEEVRHRLVPVFIGSLDYGDEVITVDAIGLRSMETEQYQSGPRSEYQDAYLRGLALELQRPLGYGLTTIPLRCRRTSTVTALRIGSPIIVDVDVVPDPGTWKRGGAQLCRVLEYSEDGPEIALRLAYLSSTSQLSAPSLAQPVQETGNTWTGVTCAVTVNASTQPVVVRYAITSTATGSAPADSSPLWRYAVNATGRRLSLFSSQTIAIRNLPPGTRVWVQGRTYSTDDALRLPSAWTIAGGTGYADTATIPAPSSLAATVSDKTCLLTWTNGAADLVTEILLATPTGDTRRKVATVEPGTTRVTLDDLDVSTQYRAEVRHALGQHVSSGDTEDFTTLGATTTAPSLVAFQELAAT